MDAGAIVAGMKAQAVIATTSLDGAIGLAAVTGADDVIAPLVAGRLDDVIGALTKLGSRQSQGLIGPGVNVASTTRQSLLSLQSGAHAGRIPSIGALESARSGIADLAARFAQLG